MQKFLRYLRIAFSAICLIACVLLIALWVRSFHVHDRLQLRIREVGPQFLVAHSLEGRFALAKKVYGGDSTILSVQNAGSPTGNAGFPDDAGNFPDSFSFRIFRWKSGLTELQIPMWFPVAIFASMSAIPWLLQFRWRFSLSTLLIATTLIAVVLGLAVWAVR